MRALILRDEQTLTTTSLLGTIVEFLAGTGAVVAAVAGLNGRNAPAMAAWATIAIGIAFLARGLVVKVRVDSRNRLPVQYEHMYEPASVRTGVTGKIVAGVGGIGLGIFALFGLPALAFAVIVFGVVLVLGAHDQPELARQAPDRDRSIDQYTWAAIHTSKWVTALAGTCASLLGVAAVIDGSPPWLSFVLAATLAVGIAQGVAAIALAIRFARHFGVAPVSA